MHSFGYALNDFFFKFFRMLILIDKSLELCVLRVVLGVEGQTLRMPFQITSIGLSGNICIKMPLITIIFH